MARVSHFVLFIVSGEKKLGKVITPDTWKDGARNTTGELRFLTKVQVLLGHSKNTVTNKGPSLELRFR